MVQDRAGVGVHCGQSGGGSGGSGPVVEGRDWRSWAPCRDVDPELFFPDEDEDSALVVERVAAAKAICAGCPVRAQCLSFALVAIPEGVAGGCSAQERAGLRARHQEASRSPAAHGAPGVAGGVADGVDELMVATLMTGHPVVGASRVELAWAAVGLRLAGHRTGWVAQRLGVGPKQVYRWLARHRAGRSLVRVRGCQLDGVSV